MVVLPLGSTYKYWDKGAIAADWAAPAFNDGAWAQGPAPLGYGDPHIATTVSFGPNPNAKFTTTWFRTTFLVKNAASVFALTLDLMRDDGARVFLNGVEAARSNLPGGAINTNTLASSIVTDAEETTFFTFSLDPALLIDGANVFAVEVHQGVSDSSDLGIEAQLTLEQLAP